MKVAHTRRQFLATLPAVAAFAQPKPLKIGAIEIWELRGHRDTIRGVDQQFQVNPLHIYDELRPDGTPRINPTVLESWPEEDALTKLRYRHQDQHGAIGMRMRMHSLGLRVSRTPLRDQTRKIASTT